MMSTTILWESRTPVVADSFAAGRILQSANGGNAYDIQAAMALSEITQVSMSRSSIKRPAESMLSYWARMRRQRHTVDVVVREPFPVVFGHFTKGVKYVAVVHHFDHRKSKGSLQQRWFFSKLKKRLTAVDLVVTVSEHWAGFLRGIGCKRVQVIYNSFDPSRYECDEQEKSGFRQRFGIPADRPVLHIGNASRQKGVHTVYAALKDKGYHLVMTGPVNAAKDLPVQYLGLDHSDYVRLLHCCSAVISMSEMEEGWNRIAHEAMLCRTPVIGNGSGGMMELLQGARQAIVSDSSQLPLVVQNVLKNREEFAEDGYRFVRHFDLDYFRSSWTNAIESLLTERP
ncbi:MAG: glycosyltransferase family 4 protein [Bacteroidota bacterium]